MTSLQKRGRGFVVQCVSIYIYKNSQIVNRGYVKQSSKSKSKSKIGDALFTSGSKQFKAALQFLFNIHNSPPVAKLTTVVGGTENSY